MLERMRDWPWQFVVVFGVIFFIGFVASQSGGMPGINRWWDD